MRALDLQYHDVDPERGLHHRMVRRGAMQRLFTDEEVGRAWSPSLPRGPGRTSGAAAWPVRRGTGRRQLGLHGVRHRRRDAQAGAYDGTAEGLKDKVEAILDQADDAAALMKAGG